MWYRLVRGITADHIHSCVLLFSVFFVAVTLQSHFMKMFLAVGGWCLPFDPTTAAIISMLTGVIFTALMNSFRVALWCSNAISQTEGLGKYSNLDTAWTVYLFYLSTDDTFKFTVDGSQSVSCNTVICLQDSIYYRVGQRDSKPHVVPFMPIGMNRLSSISHPISQ